MHDLDRLTHPTVHEVVVGDRHLPIDGDRSETSGFVGMVNRKIADAALRRRARHALGELFDPARSALSASTTLCGIVVDADGANVRMRLDNGRDVVVALYAHHPHDTYALGYGNGDEWLWTCEMRLQHLASRLSSRDGLTRRLLARPR